MKAGNLIKKIVKTLFSASPKRRIKMASMPRPGFEPATHAKSSETMARLSWSRGRWPRRQHDVVLLDNDTYILKIYI